MTTPFLVYNNAEYLRVHNIMAWPSGVFVFGSNLGGIHGAGAAKDAYQKYGAVLREGVGMQGRSYAIPTKDASFDVLPIQEIAFHVEDFLRLATSQPHKVFAVTRIGCGFSKYSDFDIAPLFTNAPFHCSLPTHWRDIILGKEFSFNWD